MTVLLRGSRKRDAETGCEANGTNEKHDEPPQGIVAATKCGAPVRRRREMMSRLRPRQTGSKARLRMPSPADFLQIPTG
jgi:hypothetical protein